MSRKQRIDTVAGAVGVASGKQRILPPAHVPLDDFDVPFWLSVIEECAGIEWTPHRLEYAAFLARNMAQVEIDQRKLRQEGAVLANDKGNLQHNPRVAAVHTGLSAIKAIRQSLGIHSRALDGEPRDAGKRRGMAKSIEAGLASGGDDDREKLLN